MLVHKGLLISLLKKQLKEEGLLNTSVIIATDRVIPWINATNSMDTLTNNHSDQKEEGMLIMLGMKGRISLKLPLMQMP